MLARMEVPLGWERLMLEQVLKERSGHVEFEMSIEKIFWVLEFRTQGKRLGWSYKTYINY